MEEAWSKHSTQKDVEPCRADKTAVCANDRRTRTSGGVYNGARGRGDVRCRGGPVTAAALFKISLERAFAPHFFLGIFRDFGSAATVSVPTWYTDEVG
jgi:hypothetical protein